MTSSVHDRPARGAGKVFQRLEKKFPIIGKNGAVFPTIGKKFSNHWKKAENFFQSLENRRKIFPIVGKLLTPEKRPPHMAFAQGTKGRGNRVNTDYPNAFAKVMANPILPRSALFPFPFAHTMA